MAHAYKHRGTRRIRRRSRRRVGWFWLAGAGVLVIFIGVLSRLHSDEPPAKPSAQSQPTQPKKRVERIPPTEFSFYTVLPGKEVIVSDEQIRVLKRAERQRLPPPEKLGALPEPDLPAPVVVEAPASKPSTRNYAIQVASYKTPQDAERLRVQLGLLGISAHVEVAQIGGTTYHRVRIGPFDSILHVDKTRQTLQQHGYASVVQTQK